MKHYEKLAMDWVRDLVPEIDKSESMAGFSAGYLTAIRDLQSKEAIEYGKNHITTNRQTWVDFLEREEE